jgi:hypothetical protein
MSASNARGARRQRNRRASAALALSLGLPLSNHQRKALENKRRDIDIGIEKRRQYLEDEQTAKMGEIARAVVTPKAKLVYKPRTR